MSKTISILGCGWLGYPLAIHWKNKGFRIQGSSRSRKKMALLEKNGIQPFLFDIEDIHRNELWKPFLEVDILVIAIPNKNIEAHRHLSELLADSDVKQVIYTSSTSVYLPTEDPVIEKDKVDTDNSLVAIEKIYQNTSTPSCILRLSGLVGPDRHPGRFFRRRPDAALAQVPINLIHLEDIIRVFDWIVDHLPCPEIYNVCSTEHPPKFDFYSKAYEAYFRKSAQFQLDQDQSAYKVISAEKFAARTHLKFSLQKYYPELF